MTAIQIQFNQEITQADLLIVPLSINQPLPHHLQKVDEALNGGVVFNIRREGFSGRKGEIVEMTTNGLYPISKVILIGIGEMNNSMPIELAPLNWQEIGGLLSEWLKGQKIAIEAPIEWIADLAFGLKLRMWQFTKYRTEELPKAKDIIFLTPDPEISRDLFSIKESLYQGVVLARNLTVEPANHLYPELFAQHCLNLCSDKIKIEILDENDLKKIGAFALLSVGKGSHNPPRLVVMQWNGGDKEQAPIALVGKGVCYDSGGINIKTKELVEMKFDKAGAAVVMGTILAMAKQKVPLNVVGVIGLAENMIDGASIKPGDIITTLSGKTVEVVNTDYEGRLILADCLWYAQEKFHPSIVIDLGTLTPETIAPLADEYAGLYCEDKQLTDALFQAGIQSGEKLWHLPMGAYFAKQIKSEYADIKNMGTPGFGEGAAAAEFLKCFVKPGTRWAHLDIAGVAWTLDHCPLNNKGITGFGVRLLIKWLLSSIQPMHNYALCNRCLISSANC